MRNDRPSSLTELGRSEALRRNRITERVEKRELTETDHSGFKQGRFCLTNAMGSKQKEKKGKEEGRETEDINEHVSGRPLTKCC